jgi:peptidoglycan/xylan/chitin deacetylase (PgdA/CDA1 family)
MQRRPIPESPAGLAPDAGNRRYRCMFDLTLTFDNGPEPEATPGVLEVLARRGIKATFFVIGAKLNRPEGRKLAERAHAQGHWIGNHSWTHSVPLGQRREADVAEFEIGRTQAAMKGLIHPHRYFRPFGGGGNLDRRLMSKPVVDYLVRGRYTCVLWNSIPRDWNDPDGWVERALSHCASQPNTLQPSTLQPSALQPSALQPSALQSWTLMVLHDLPTGAMRHLDAFLDKVGEAGGRIRQDFPPDCVPIVDGVVVRPIDDYVAAA